MVKIIKVKYQKVKHVQGCETCDFGTEFISDLTIRINVIYDFQEDITFSFKDEDNYVSEEDVIKLLSREYKNKNELIKAFIGYISETKGHELDIQNIKIEQVKR